MTIVPRKCPVETCERVIYTAKYCSMHMKRLMLGNDPHARSRNDPRPIIDNGDGTSLIPLQKLGEYAIIDTDDKHLVYGYKFYNTARNAVVASGSKVKLHHLIMGKPDKGLVIDHINRNHLDNRRSNLRFTSQKLNSVNTGKHIVGTSVYKGVWNDKRNNKWIAELKYERKKIYIGRFATEIEAARAYNAKALELWGEYAYLNDV